MKTEFVGRKKKKKVSNSIENLPFVEWTDFTTHPQTTHPCEKCLLAACPWDWTGL